MKKEFQPLALVLNCRYCNNKYTRALRLTDQLIEDKEGLGNFLSWQFKESLEEMENCPGCENRKEIENED